MLGETYDIESSPNKLSFSFTSIGSKGAIEKIVLFQPIGINRFNLAFGDVEKGRVNDKVVSGNNDFVKVLATVAKCVYEFVGKYPGSVLRIIPVDRRRGIVYNAAIERHFDTISKKFMVLGLLDGKWQRYQAGSQYEGFELSHLF